MGCAQSKTSEYELIEKKLSKLHKKVEDMEANLKRLVEIINNIPGSSINVDHLKINKSMLLQNGTSGDYISLSFDEKTKKLKINQNTLLKQNQCTIM